MASRADIPEARVARGWRRVRLLLELIKLEHTVFALPFALMSALVAAHGWPRPWILVWILVAMVGARTSAMAFNRLADLDYDRRNPRTAARALPRGLVTPAQVWSFTAASAAVFLLAAGMLNHLALALAPVALAGLWGYSYSKRFTTWSHVWLGLCLGIAPVGAWVAVRAEIGFPSLLLAAAVTLWTAGFDIIYASQDVAFDRAEGLYSAPARLGLPFALALSALLHAAMLGLLIWFGVVAHLGFYYRVGLAVVVIAFIYQHAIVRPGDLRRVNAAFFTANGVVSLGLLVATMLDAMSLP
jgi:4-hydroxybenzoate polyprenyltransferase